MRLLKNKMKIYFNPTLAAKGLKVASQGGPGGSGNPEASESLLLVKKSVAQNSDRSINSQT